MNADAGEAVVTGELPRDGRCVRGHGFQATTASPRAAGAPLRIHLP